MNFIKLSRGKRWFRVRFENGGPTATTSFNVYSYFGVFNNGMLPVSQSISSDQDSMVVRSVAVGAEPDGSFSNTKQDGSAFRTTTNLAGTTLSSGITSSNSISIPLNAHTALFPPSGYIYIGSEFIAYDSYDMIGVITGGSGYTNGSYTNVSTTGGTGSGMTLDITVSGGAVTAATVNTFGGGYAKGDSVVPDSDTLGGGTSASIALVDDTTGMTATERGSFNTTPAAHSSSDVVGEAYDSTVLTLEGYTEVATKFLSSNTGQGRFIWYSDLAGTDTIRTLPPVYPPAGGTIGTYDYLAAPSFGPYVRYVFANTQSTATTDFYFETEFYTKSISAQVLTVNSTILGVMTSNLTRSILSAKNPQGTYSNITTSIDQSLDVSVLNPNTAFGELAIARLTPFIQQQFTYYNGAMSTNNFFSIKLSGGGEVNGGNGQMTLSSNTNEGSHAIYQSLKLTKYRPGQGTRFRGTVSFSPSRSNLIQVFGFGDSSSGFFFKDSGSGMTTVRRNGGRREIQKLEIITEPTADGTCIVTLDDIPNYVQILDADDLGGVAYKIANSPDIPWADIGDGWFVWYDTTNVYFESIFSKDTYTGTYSLAAGTATSTDGTFTQLVAGVNHNETSVARASWDDPCDGTVAMPVTDFSFGNVYQILFQWLGYGQITYSMENSETGRFANVYKIKYTNSTGVPTVTEPNGFVHIGTLNSSTPNSQTFTGTTGGSPPDIDQVNDTFDINSHGFTDGNFVSYDTGGGTAIGGISTENYTKTFDGSDSLVVDVASDIIEISKHGFSHTEEVLYTASATAIGGLTTATLYYVIKRNASKIQLATTKANAETYKAIDLTAVGTGTVDTLAAKRFYVVNSTTNDFQLSLTPGGSAISITDGSGASQRLFEVVASPAYITVDGSSGSVVSGTTITFTAHGFSDYEALVYDNYSAGTDILGLTNLGLYYVRDSAANTFALSSTRGGGAILLNTGTGVEHRFSVVGAMSTASVATFTEGEDIITGQEYSASGRQQQTTADTTEYPLLAIFNKKVYNELPNKNNIVIKDLSFGYSKVNAADKETTAEFRAYINPGISTISSVFTEVDPDISVAEESQLSTTDRLVASTGRRVLTNFTSIGGSGTDVNFILSPGDMFVITGRSPSSTAIVLDCACRWVEDL